MDSKIPTLYMGDPNEMQANKLSMGGPVIPGPENVNVSEDFVKKKKE